VFRAVAMLVFTFTHRNLRHEFVTSDLVHKYVERASCRCLDIEVRLLLSVEVCQEGNNNVQVAL
jgi:hypothetical protein